MKLKQLFAGMITIYLVTVACASCGEKPSDYPEVQKFAEEIIQIKYDSVGYWKNLFLSKVDPMVGKEKANRMLHQQVIPFGPMPQSSIILEESEMEVGDKFTQFTFRFTVLRKSEHRYLDYKIKVNKYDERIFLADLFVLDRQIKD